MVKPRRLLVELASEQTGEEPGPEEFAAALEKVQYLLRQGATSGIDTLTITHGVDGQGTSKVYKTKWEIRD